MKVKELIKQLQKLDQDKEIGVTLWSEKNDKVEGIIECPIDRIYENGAYQITGEEVDSYCAAGFWTEKE